jgi:hypothetical protein
MHMAGLTPVLEPAYYDAHVADCQGVGHAAADWTNSFGVSGQSGKTQQDMGLADHSGMGPRPQEMYIAAIPDRQP